MIEAATFEAVENAAKMFGAQPGPKPETNGRFDVVAYLNHYGIGYKIKGNGGKTIYALDHCVFDSSHTNNDAAIFQFPEGKLGYKCHHDSCMGKGWQEARQAISGTDNLKHFMTAHGQAKAEQKPELTVCTLGELDRMKKNFPPPLIDGLLEKGDSLLITGPGGLGKSLVTMAIAVAVASGKRLFDRYDISMAHAILLLQSENSLKATKSRLSALMDTYRNRKDYLDYRQALDRIFTTLLPGDECRLAGNILDEGFSDMLKEILLNTKAQLLILDPLISYHRQNENDNTGMREALDQLSRIVGPDVSTIVTHHHSKSIEATGANKARGASAILDWSRGILTLTKQKHETKQLIRVSHTKAGNFKAGAPFLLEVNGPCVVAVEPDICAPPSKVVEILYDLGGTANSKNELVKTICEACDVSRRTAQEAINTAQELGFIKEIKTAKSFTYATV